MCVTETPRGKYQCVLIWVAILVTVFVVLIGISFSKVDYNQYGFVKARISGKIDRSKVYVPGAQLGGEESSLYFLGPDNFFVTYPSVVVDLQLNDLEVWSKASVDAAGTPLKIDISLQYKLDPDRLEELYAKVGLDFEPFVRNVAIDVLKSTATNFTADEYLSSRELIEESFQTVCESALLTASDVIVDTLMLKHVDFPASYYSRKLAAAIQNQKNLIQEYKKTATLTRGNTSVAAEEILNEARQVKENADAEAKLLQETAKNQAIKIKAEADRNGITAVKSALNLVDSKDVLSMHYLLQLKSSDSLPRSFINFNDLPEAKSLL